MLLCDLFGKKVNQRKSRVCFSLNVPVVRMEEFCSCLNFHSKPNLENTLDSS